MERSDVEAELSRRLIRVVTSTLLPLNCSIDVNRAPTDTTALTSNELPLSCSTAVSRVPIDEIVIFSVVVDETSSNSVAVSRELRPLIVELSVVAAPFNPSAAVRRV